MTKHTCSMAQLSIITWPHCLTHRSSTMRPCTTAQLRLIIVCVHNQKSNRSRFVGWDRFSDFSPMKKNALVRFITVTHTVTTLFPMPQSLWLAIWNWLLECLHHMRHGCSLQKICPWSQVFLRCIRADLDLIMNAEHFARIDRIFDYECSQWPAVCPVILWSFSVTGLCDLCTGRYRSA